MKKGSESLHGNTPEEQAKLADSRTLSDAELIKGGAEHVPTGNGDMRLDLKDRQKKEVLEERRKELIQEYAKLDTKSAIQSVPGLSEKVELLNCDRGIFVVREKDIPDIGVLGFDSKSDASVFFRLNFKDSRIPDETVYKKFGAASVVNASFDRLNEHLKYGDSEKELDPLQIRRQRQAKIEEMCTANGIKRLVIDGFVPEDDQGWIPQHIELAYVNTWGEKQNLIQTARSAKAYDTSKPYPNIDTGVAEPSYHGDNSW